MQRAERSRRPAFHSPAPFDKATGERTPSDCRNCFTYAVRYREEVMQALRDGADDRDPHGQMMLDLFDQPADRLAA